MRFWNGILLGIAVVLIASAFAVGGPVQLVDVSNTVVFLPSSAEATLVFSSPQTVDGPIEIDTTAVIFHDIRFNMEKLPHDASTVDVTISTWTPTDTFYWAAQATAGQQAWFNVSGLPSAEEYTVTIDNTVTQEHVSGGTVNIHYVFGAQLGQFSLVKQPGSAAPDPLGGFFAICGLLGGLIFVLFIVSYFGKSFSGMGGGSADQAGSSGGFLGFHWGGGGGGGAAAPKRAERKVHAKPQKATPMEKMMGLDKIDFGGMRLETGPKAAKAREKPAPSGKPSGLSSDKVDKMMGLDKIDTAFNGLKAKPKPRPSDKPRPSGGASPFDSKSMDKMLGLDKFEMEKLKTTPDAKRKEPVKSKGGSGFDSNRMDKLLGLDKINFGDLKGKKVTGKTVQTKPPEKLSGQTPFPKMPEPQQPRSEKKKPKSEDEK
jgi:hypothetical protein